MQCILVLSILDGIKGFQRTKSARSPCHETHFRNLMAFFVASHGCATWNTTSSCVRFILICQLFPVVDSPTNRGLNVMQSKKNVYRKWYRLLAKFRWFKSAVKVEPFKTIPLHYLPLSQPWFLIYIRMGEKAVATD